MSSRVRTAGASGSWNVLQQLKLSRKNFPKHECRFVIMWEWQGSVFAEQVKSWGGGKYEIVMYDEGLGVPEFKQIASVSKWLKSFEGLDAQIHISTDFVV